MDSNRAPKGHVPKLVVNPLAGVIAAGTGRCLVMRAGDALVHEALALNELVPRLGPALRHVVDRHAERAADPIRFGQASYFVVGTSRRLGRIVGFVLEAPQFWPRIVTSFASPHLAELPAEPAQVAGIAIEQMADLHRGTSHCGGGWLTIATITTTEITARRVLDFSAGSWSPASNLSAAMCRGGGRPSQEPAADPLPVLASA